MDKILKREVDTHPEEEAVDAQDYIVQDVSGNFQIYLTLFCLSGGNIGLSQWCLCHIWMLVYENVLIMSDI